MYHSYEEKEIACPSVSPISTIHSASLPTIEEYPSNASNNEDDWKPSTQVKKTVACQILVLFIVSIDSTILTTTLPAVAKALKANSMESFWIVASYLLASAVCQPVTAAMADLCGRLFVSMSAVVLFSVGSVICSIANNVEQMLVGRSIQGLGGGGIMSMNLILLADLIPLPQRPKYQGLIQLVFGLGTALAPILGGALAEHDWRCPKTLVPIALGGLGLIATIWYESRVASMPFLRTSVFKDRTAAIALSGTLMQGFILFSEVYLIPMYFFACKLYTPKVTGAALLPLCLTVVPVSGVVGGLISRFRSYRWAVWGGWMLNTLGLGLLALLTPRTPTAAWVAILFCAGLGQGMLLMGQQVVVPASVDKKDESHAVNMYSSLRSLGFCLGLSVGSGVILMNFLKQHKHHSRFDVDFNSGADSFVATVMDMGTSPSQVQSQEAFSWAWQRTFIVLASLSGFELLRSMWICHKPLTRDPHDEAGV
ncbi:hypothetical protein Q7P37_009781 [Cladosporium fusiforme]